MLESPKMTSTDWNLPAAKLMKHSGLYCRFIYSWTEKEYDSVTGCCRTAFKPVQEWEIVWGTNKPLLTALCHRTFTSCTDITTVQRQTNLTWLVNPMERSSIFHWLVFYGILFLNWPTQMLTTAGLNTRKVSTEDGKMKMEKQFPFVAVCSHTRLGSDLASAEGRQKGWLLSYGNLLSSYVWCCNSCGTHESDERTISTSHWKFWLKHFCQLSQFHDLI